MKIFRSLAVVLFVSAFSLAAVAQESSEVAGLRAKAVKGNGIAQYNLGLAYAQGRGIAADQVEAFVWLSLARENGARGRALDTVIGSLDKASLDLATQRLAERKTALGVRPPAPTTVRAEIPVETPAVVAPPRPGAAVETRGTPAPAGEDSASATLRAERDALAVRVNNLSGNLAELRGERERLTKLAADNEKAARTAEARIAELARATEATKAELAQTRQALAAKPPAPKPVADTAALDAKSRELQAALAELEAAKNFGRQVEDTLNKVNDDRARVAAGAAAELEAAKNFGRQVEETLNKVNDQKASLEAQLTAAKQELAAKPGAPAYPDLSGRVGELEAALATTRTATPKYPDLRARVTELETQFAALAAEAGRTKQEMAALAKAKDGAQAAAIAREQELARANTKLAGDETAFAALSAEATRAKQEAVALTKAKDDANRELAAAKFALAAKPAAPKYPDLSGRVSELETALATVRSAAPKYPDLSGRVGELEAQLSKAKQPVAPAYSDLRPNVAALEEQLAAAKQSLAAKPAYPDLRGQVGELESKLAAANSAAGGAQQQIAALTQAKANAEQALAAKPVAPAYPDLSGRVRELEAVVTTQSSEAARAKQEIVALTKAKEDARNATPAYPNLSGKVAELEASLAQTSAALAAKPAAPKYPDLSGRVSELETALTAARNAAPAYPNLSGRVTELESSLAAASADSSAVASAKAEANRAKQEVVALTKAKEDATTAKAEALAQMATLTQARQNAEQALAARSSEAASAKQQVAALTKAKEDKPSAPAYPDLSGRVTELEKALADSSRQLVATQSAKAAPAYPDLSGRVTELETAVATALQKFGTADQARTEISRQFDDYKSATATAARERTTLQSSLKMLESDKVALRRQVDAATAESNQLRTQVATLKTQAAGIKPAAPAYPDLSGKVTELEAALTTARNATPAYPDLSSRVHELEAQASSDSSAVASAKAEAASAKQQVAALTKAKEDKPAAPSYPDVSGRVTELESALTAARNAPPAYPNLSGKVSELETKLAASTSAAGQATQQIAALTQAKDAAEKAAAAKPAAPVYPDLRDRVASLESDLTASRKALAAKPAAPGYPDLSGRVGELEAALTAAHNAAPSYPNLTPRVAELEAALAAKPAAPSYPDLSGRVNELETSLAATKQQLAAKPAAPSYPDLSGRVTELESALTAARNAPPAYPNLSGKVTELETSLAQTNAALAAKPAAPSYPDLSGRVSELETALTAARNAAPAYPNLSDKVAGLEAKLAASTSAAGQTTQQIAALTQAKDAAEKSAAAKPATPAYPDLSGKVAGLNGEVSQLRADRERMQKMLADSGRQLAEATAANRSRPVAPPGYADRMRELETTLAATKQQLAAAQGTPAYPDLSGKVTDLETKLAAAEKSATEKPAAPAYPDLSGKVADLTSEVSQLRIDRERMQQMIATAGRQMRDTTADSTRIKDLETQLAALASEAAHAKQEIVSLTVAKDAAQAQAGGAASERDAARVAQNDLRDSVTRLEQEKARLTAAPAAPASAPAYPDLSGRVSELETQLAQAKAAPRGRTAAPAYPDLSSRVSELETALAQSQQRLAAAQTTPATGGDTGDLAKKLTDTEDRLATSLRGYAALQRDRDALADSAGKSTAAVTAERDSLAAQVAGLNGQVEQLRTAAQSSSGSTQAELNRLNDAVAALQRTSTQSSHDLAATRALAQQLQGANAVLAGENYQLKTMLSRTTGSPATATAATPVSVPGARTHVVAAGDSLSRLSQRYYGNANRWQEIYNANATLLGPNGILKVGTELRIP